MRMSEIFTKAEILLTQKREKLDELKDAVNSETSLKLKLLHKANKVKLNPDIVKDELELTKLPTEKQIQAYIDETYNCLTDDYELAKQNTALIKKELEFLDDCISLEKYVLRSNEL
jgi:hypothetical protein